MTDPAERTYIFVDSYGKCISDNIIGYNYVSKKFYKSAQLDGRAQLVFSEVYNGSQTVWSVKD